MFRVAICEDDAAMRSYEKELVSGWAKVKGHKAAVDVYANAEQYLFAMEDELEYDLLILDIQMGELNGIELATKLRDNGVGAQILFLTGVPDYALEGYEVGAVRYLRAAPRSSIHSERVIFSTCSRFTSSPLLSRKKSSFPSCSATEENAAFHSNSWRSVLRQPLSNAGRRNVWVNSRTIF